MKSGMYSTAGTAVVVVSCVFFVAGAPAHAETAGSWGLYLGLNVANMTGDIDEFNQRLVEFMEDEFGNEWTVTNKTRTGFLGGAYYHLPLSGKFGIQVEGLWVKRGMKQEFSTDVFAADVSIGLNYVEFPLLMRWSPSPGGKTGFFCILGAVIGLNTSTDMTVSSGDESDTVNVGADFKSTAYSAVGGIGLETRIAETASLHVQARYQLGLSNALENSEFSLRSSDFSIIAGLGFSLSP